MEDAAKQLLTLLLPNHLIYLRKLGWKLKNQEDSPRTRGKRLLQQLQNPPPHPPSEEGHRSAWCWGPAPLDPSAGPGRSGDASKRARASSHDSRLFFRYRQERLDGGGKLPPPVGTQQCKGHRR